MHKLYAQYPAAVACRSGHLEHEMVFHLFGIPLTVASNSVDLIEAVDAALGRWKSLPTSYRADIAPRRLELITTKRFCGKSFSRLTWRNRCGILMVSGIGLSGAATESSGSLYASQEWTSRGREFADTVVAPLAVYLASENLAEDRVFLRASAFVHGDAALVLLAESEAPRLALAGGLYQAGFEMLASDSLLVARHPVRGLEFWGHPSFVPVHPAPDSDDSAADSPPAQSKVWASLPMEGGVKVHLQHVGSVLLAVLDDTAPGPDSDAFPAAMDTTPQSMHQRFMKLASHSYPPPVGNETLDMPPASQSILKTLARSRTVRIPSANPDAMLQKLLPQLKALSR